MAAIPLARRPSLIVAAAPLILALAAITVGYGQMALGLGLSPQEFSAPGDATVRAAPYAFAIWGLIYAGLIAMGIFEALPAGRPSAAAAALRRPSIIALAGITAWVIAAAADLRWLTLVLIAGSCAVLVVPLIGARDRLSAARGRERWLVVWPVALLAGWLTVASVLNILNVLTSEGLIPQAARLPWAFAGIAAASVIASIVTTFSRQGIYAAPVAWGLIGVFVAERGDGDLAVAWPALGGALIVAMVGGVVFARDR